MSDRIVLAYSGGLDTSVCIGWLADETGQEVVAVAVDVGQGGEDLELIRQRALDCGAVLAERLLSMSRGERTGKDAAGPPTTPDPHHPSNDSKGRNS